MTQAVGAKPPAPPGPDGDGIVAFRSASPGELAKLDRAHGWSLHACELAAIQARYRTLGREPTRAELETIAQTWSEHCKHKTLTGPISYSENGRARRFKNLLAETVMDATRRLRKPWCLSVFEDNAGIVSFGPRWALACKVETHNHPCALEPYGGATTGVGGVIRDVLAAGLGARPILNTDVFCLCPPDFEGALPEGAIHPRRALTSIVAGVRDYGNRVGIPTAAGALWFDEDYGGTPLVFCGTLGLLPEWAVSKEARPGDLIVAAGGRTGRDGIHGATFSSAGLDDGASPAAVQVGHAIMEKRLLDGLMAARDRKLYGAVTDCGAGGFSSAIGELARGPGGASVRLDGAMLKASDLAPWEIWVSESQERMVLAVPPRSLKALEEAFAAEGVELAVLGEFTSSGRLEVSMAGRPIVDLDLRFLHEGLPRRERRASWSPPKPRAARRPTARLQAAELKRAVYGSLGHLNVCSRAWIIRQYDHEVQAGTVIKPLQGAQHDGPGDACVFWPYAATGDAEDFQGIAVAHGLNPGYGKLDPRAMALCCVDEALRNLVCVGADVTRASLLDNFCWGSPDDPQVLGGLVRAALGCREAALGYQAPFISGKDSLHNEWGEGGRPRAVPGTLLVTAVAPVVDIRKALTMEFKAPGDAVFLVGKTGPDLGGACSAALTGLSGRVPVPSPAAARAAMLALGGAIGQGLVSACHDLSEGGLAVAAAEMAFSGELGAVLDLDRVPRPGGLEDEAVILFSESPSRFLVEVPPEKERAFLRAMKGACVAKIGSTMANPVLRLLGMDGSTLLEEPLAGLKGAWLRRLPGAINGIRFGEAGAVRGRRDGGR